MKFEAYFKKYSQESEDGWRNVLFPNGSCCIEFDVDIEFEGTDKREIKTEGMNKIYDRFRTLFVNTFNYSDSFWAEYEEADSIFFINEETHYWVLKEFNDKYTKFMKGDKDFMTPEQCRESLKYILHLQEEGVSVDTETNHIDADNALCELLSYLGYDEIVDLYQQVDKWYA